LKVYKGIIIEDIFRGSWRTERKVIVKDLDRHMTYELPLYIDEVNHSPTGFNWGYTGSGPAQLAYAILRDHGLSRDEANVVYMAFKRDVIARLDMSRGFELTSEDIDRWLNSVIVRG